LWCVPVGGEKLVCRDQGECLFFLGHEGKNWPNTFISDCNSNSGLEYLPVVDEVVENLEETLFRPLPHNFISIKQTVFPGSNPGNPVFLMEKSNYNYLGGKIA